MFILKRKGKKLSVQGLSVQTTFSTYSAPQSCHFVKDHNIIRKAEKNDCHLFEKVIPSCYKVQISFSQTETEDFPKVIEW